MNKINRPRDLKTPKGDDPIYLVAKAPDHNRGQHGWQLMQFVNKKAFVEFIQQALDGGKTLEEAGLILLTANVHDVTHSVSVNGV